MIAGLAALALAAPGVTVAAVSPATAANGVVSLPVSWAGGGAAHLEGAVKLRAEGHSVAIRAPEVVPGPRTRVVGVLAGRRMTVWALDGGRLTLAPTAAQEIRRRLRTTIPRKAFGTLTVTLPVKPSTCPATAATAPAGARPAGALDISAATLVWHVRDSFVRYIASGEGASALDGATADPPEGDPPLVYAFRFPFSGGWCDPETGAAHLAFTGTVRFSYAGHGIDLRASDPEVELNGSAAQVSFRFGAVRAVVETLDLRAVAGYERIPGAIPPGAADSVFAGYYLPGDPFGWVSVSFTTT